MQKMTNGNEGRKPTQSLHGQKENIIVEGEGRVTESPSGFRFSRLFPASVAQPMALKLSSCEQIGARMTNNPEEARGDSTLPAGYTYFGQFVDHDISMDGTKLEAEDPSSELVEQTADADLLQLRSPSLDLDSLYGSTSGGNKELFNGPRFKLGLTTPSPGRGHSSLSIPYDLPRSDVTRPGSAAKQALIGDGRNDENLAVAQIHLVFLKFHNLVVDRLLERNPMADTDDVIREARDIVTRHYQWIVLHDFVKRYVDEEIFEDIVEKGNRRLLTQVPGEVAAMPLEFSVAAYRHGHSQVREVYDWNVNFGTGAGLLPSSQFRLLFEFSQVSGNLGRNPTLPSNWIPDFRRLFELEGDFPNLRGSVEGRLNVAKKIDPYLAPALSSLPEVERLVQMGLRPFANLAALNLRRGSMRGLPSGQDVSRELANVRMLTKTEMKSVIDDQFDVVMNALGFYDRTPLWLYVLLEAAVRGEGNRLGQLGSVLSVETFVNILVTSRTSILDPNVPWHPSDSNDVLGSDVPINSMPELLKWIDVSHPIIDPLQDERVGGVS